MKLRQLRAVLGVAHWGSMSAAARAMNLSQPAVSRIIDLLEADLQVKLFRRVHNGAELTRAGDFLVRAGRKTFRHLAPIECGEDAVVESADLCFRSAFMRQVTDRELAALVSYGGAGSARRAAEIAGITRTALMRSLATFSARIGRPLFEPDQPKRLTAWTADAVARARRALGEIEAAEAVLREDRDGARPPVRIKIGALPASRAHLVPEAVRRFAKDYPSSQAAIVDARYDDLLSQLHAGDIDLIVGSIRMSNRPTWARAQILFEDHLVAVSHPDHPLQYLPEVDWWDLRAARWVLPSRQTPIRTEFERLLSRHAIPAPSHVVEVDSFIAARALLLSGEWLGVFSASQIIPEERAGILKRLPLSKLGECRQVGVLLRRGERLAPALARFLDYLRDVSGGLASDMALLEPFGERRPKLIYRDAN